MRTAAVAPRVLGRLQEFDPKVDNISRYLERLELYFEANAVEAGRKVSVLLTVIGAQAYDTLHSLLAPTLPRNTSFEDLIAALKSHFDPTPLVIGERFHFYKRSQRANESVAEFLADLRRLCIHCEFGDFLNQALRDRFVCGIRSETIQKRLLAEDGLTVTNALTIAQGMEAADKNSKDLKGGGENSSVSDGMNFAGAKGGKAKACFRCGRRHEERTCKFKDAECHKCGKTGHIAPVCRSESKHQSSHPKPTGPPPSQARKPRPHFKKKSGGTRWLDTNESPDRGERVSLYTVKNNSVGAQPPIVVDMELDGKITTLEVDTGATVTVMSEKTFRHLFPSQRLQRSAVGLKTYTGEPMRIAGEVQVKVLYKDQPSRELPLVVVQGSGPTLLGRNWLRHFRLDWNSIKSVSARKDPLATLLQEYDEVFTDELGTIKPAKAKLCVSPTATPKFNRPRSVPYALKAAVEEELDRLEQAGVLERVDHSEWATPIVVVPKKDGRVRICGDYKVTVNPVLDINQYPLPRPEDLFATLAGGKHFTTLDLSHAYNQIVLDDEARKFLTINTHRGLYRYNRLPFGVASAPALFQRTMDTILQGLDGVICYIDDILISGKTEEEHLEILRKVLQRLKEHGIRLKKSKCEFLKPSVQYLGHRIDADGIHATDSKLKAITEAPTPKNLQELRSFLGLLNYYGRFIPRLSSLIHPLNELLRQDSTWKWTKACHKAFQEAKAKIVSPNVLVHYDATLPIKMAGDASAYGIGAVISHVMRDGTERPIAFASRTLLPSERNYSQVEKEALSLIFGVSKFHTYLYGRPFVLVTDHKPLTTILGPKKGVPPMAAARLQRWALKLSAYQYQIEFRRTDEHSNADGLSRLPLNRVSTTGHTPEPAVFNMHQIESLPVTATQLATATRTDSVLSKVYRNITKGWPRQIDKNLSSFVAKKDELTVEGGCVLWGTRVVVPEKWREKVLSELHRDHPGIWKMKGVARSYVWWPGLDKSIENLARSCQDCHAVKNSPPAAPLHPWMWPSRVFQRVHIDFAGPFQGSMFLVAVDAYSKWPEVCLMQNTTVSKTIEALRQMFARNGLPEQIVSDNGPQFISEEFAVFMKMNGVKHTRSSPYHPSTNGLAERFVQSLKQSLKATQGSGLPLSQRLCNFLLTYRSSVHATTGVTPSSLFLKREVRTRLDLMKPDSESRVLEKQSQQKADHDKHARTRQFSVGDLVMAKNLRSGADWIPATIVARLGPLSFLVETQDKLLWRRHVDHLKDRTIQHNSKPAPYQDPDPDDEYSGPVFQPATEQPPDQLPDQPPELPDSTPAQVVEPERVVTTPPGTPTATPPRRYPSRERTATNFYKPSW